MTDQPTRGLRRPFHRTCRQLKDGSYDNGGIGRYIRHKAFAKDPDMYVRAFLLLQKDLIGLFDYVEPCDENKNCYSHRIHEVLVRAAIEVEANFKAILLENGYPILKKKNGDELRWNIGDYRKLNATHRLSSYRVEVPYWRGDNRKRPFDAWGGTGVLEWYDAYNASKHDRHASFKRANLKNAVEAVAALAVVLTSQFYTESFTPGPDFIASGGSYQDADDTFISAIGGFFSVCPPRDWPLEDRYDFTRDECVAMEAEDNPFDNLVFE